MPSSEELRHRLEEKSLIRAARQSIATAANSDLVDAIIDERRARSAYIDSLAQPPTSWVDMLDRMFANADNGG